MFGGDAAEAAVAESASVAIAAVAMEAGNFIAARLGTRPFVTKEKEPGRCSRIWLNRGKTARNEAAYCPVPFPTNR